MSQRLSRRIEPTELPPTWLLRRSFVRRSTWMGLCLRVTGLLLTCCIVLLVAAATQAQEERVIDQEPFDEITLNAANEGQVLKVLPLPPFTQPTAPRATDAIRVRLVSNPTEEIDVLWTGIDRIVTFGDRVLEAARQLVALKEFDEAFEYIKFVRDNYPKTAGLDDALDRALVAEALSLFREANFERAAMLLDDVYQRSPNNKKLAASLSTVLDAEFNASIAASDFQGARRHFERAQAKYANAMSTMLSTWQVKLLAESNRLLRQGEAELAQGDLRGAYLHGRRALEVWPQTPGAKEFASQTSTRYPLLLVGVTQPSPSIAVSRGDAAYLWSARRSERLTSRKLFEIQGVTADGAAYGCPVGKATLADDARSMRIELEPTENGPLLSAGHLAQMLLSAAESRSENYDAKWASQLARVAVPDLMTVEMTYRRPVLRPQAMLNVSLTDISASALANSFQPYRVEPDPQSTSLMRFVINPEYVRTVATQPREIVEMATTSTQQGLRKLRRGEIDLLDRVFPADVAQLRREDKYVVSAYRLPSLHVLVPNNRRSFAGNRVFRRSIAYAIDRRKILQRDLLGNSTLPGCTVISGPFSPGVATDDPMAFAYDSRVEPQAYDPRHARTLIQLAQIEINAVAAKRGEPAPTLQELVLACPPSEIAQTACDEIVAQLKIIGVNCRLRSLSPEQVLPPDDNWDFVYVDYQMTEPTVEASRLLGAEGLVGSHLSHLNLALRQLSETLSWNDAGIRLRAIHQICADDMTVVPLWQLVDFMVRRPGVQGLPSEPVTTYDGVENWRLDSEADGQ